MEYVRLTCEPSLGVSLASRYSRPQIDAQEQRELAAFDLFTTYATKAACRREFLLGHFGEKLVIKKGESREHCCDYCCDPVAVQRSTQRMHRNRGGLRTHPSSTTPVKRNFSFEYDNRSTTPSYFQRRRLSRSGFNSSCPSSSSEASRVAVRTRKGGTISVLDALMRAEERSTETRTTKTGHKRSLRERFK